MFGFGRSKQNKEKEDLAAKAEKNTFKADDQFEIGAFADDTSSSSGFEVHAFGSESERSEMVLEYNDSSDSEEDLAATARAAKSNKLLKGAPVEVFSRNGERWVLGLVRKRVQGRVTVKFNLDGAPYRKNMNPDSLHLRKPSIAAGDEAAQAERMARTALRNVLVNGHSVAKALTCRWLEPGCFIAKIALNGDCELLYTGPVDEDTVLKVFKGTKSRDAPTYDYVGCIHAMQPGSRHLYVPGSSDSYLLALELKADLNRPLLRRMPPSRQRSYLRAVFSNLPLEHAGSQASECDFVACFLSRQLETNIAILWRLRQFGVKSGPWGPMPKTVTCCTDASLGLGLHFMNSVELILGGLTFRESVTDENWFQALGEAAAKTKYGVLFLDPSEKYFNREQSQNESAWVDLNRQYVYAHDQDCIMLVQEMFKHVLDSAPLLIQAAAKGALSQVDDLLADGTEELAMTDQQERTALHYAALYGHAEVVDRLAFAKADLESWSAGGTTPLHLAALGGHEAAVSQLLMAEADVDVRTYAGRGALHFAALGGRLAVVEQLLAASADVHSQDQQLDTPLDYALVPGPDVTRRDDHRLVAEVLLANDAHRGKHLPVALELIAAIGGPDPFALGAAATKAKAIGIGPKLLQSADARMEFFKAEMLFEELRDEEAQAEMLNPDKASKFLYAAISSSDIVLIREAIDMATAHGVDARQVATATKHLRRMQAHRDVSGGSAEELQRKRRATAALEAAVRIENEVGLLQAIEEGEDAGVEPKKLLEAERILDRLNKIRALEMAVLGGDSPTLRKAVRGAADLEVDEDLLDAGNERLKVLQAEEHLIEAMLSDTTDEKALSSALAAARAHGVDNDRLEEASSYLTHMERQRLMKEEAALFARREEIQANLPNLENSENEQELRTAIQEAIAAHVTKEHLLEVERQLQKVVKTRELKEADVAGKEDLLIAAIKAASDVGVDEVELHAAEHRLHHLQATREMEGAIRTQNEELLRKAIQAAKEAGTDPADRTAVRANKELRKLEATRELHTAVESQDLQAIRDQIVIAGEAGVDPKVIKKAEKCIISMKGDFKRVGVQAIKAKAMFSMGQLAERRRSEATEKLKSTLTGDDEHELLEAVEEARKAEVEPDLLADGALKVQKLQATRELEAALASTRSPPAEDIDIFQATLRGVMQTAREQGVDGSLLDSAQSQLESLEVVRLQVAEVKTAGQDAVKKQDAAALNEAIQQAASLNFNPGLLDGWRQKLKDFEDMQEARQRSEALQQPAASYGRMSKDVTAVAADKRLGMIPGNLPPGYVLVKKVDQDGWADKSGISVGSQITAVNGQSLADMPSEVFKEMLQQRPVTLSVLPPSGSSAATIAAPSAAATSIGSGPSEVTAGEDITRLGFLPENLPPGNVVVKKVDEATWADEVGMQPGTTITAVEGKLCTETSADDFKLLLKQRPVTFSILPPGAETVPVEDSQPAAAAAEAVPVEDSQPAAAGAETAPVEDSQPAAAETAPAEDSQPAAAGAETAPVEDSQPAVAGSETAPVEDSQQAAEPVTKRFAEEPETFAAPPIEEAIAGSPAPAMRRLVLDHTAEDDVKVLGMLPDNLPPGDVIVKKVESGGWADKNGWRVGTAIVAVNARPLAEMSAEDFKGLMRQRPVTFSILQPAGEETSHKALTFQVTARESARRLGLRPQNLPPGAVVVEKVETGSWADLAGIRAGNQIVSINGKPLTDMLPDDFKALFKERPITFSVLRSKEA